MAFPDPGNELYCSICLTLYTDPVTLRCGHNFCQGCMDQVLTTQDESGIYSCPECREEFHERPALRRNRSLSNVLENFLSNHGGESSLLGTYCVDSPVPTKSCLHYEASLCDKRLTSHNKGPEHVLTDPSTSLETRKCSVHEKVLEYYCPEDAACICASCCLTGEHEGHKFESLDKALGKKKKLRNVLQKTMTQRRKTEETVQSLARRRRRAQEKASGEAKRVTAMFIDIRRRVDDLEQRVLSDISRREEKMSLSLSDMIQKLELKKDELSRKVRDIEELCNMADPLTVLPDPDTGDLCDPDEAESDDIRGHDGGDGGAELISRISHSLFAIIRDVNSIYVQDPADILLDVDTAGNNLIISNDLKTATWTEITENRLETAERFRYYQVMSRRGFTSGRYYWDVEISGLALWMVGMCYPSIDRKGRQSYIGNNNKSWCLYRGLVCDDQYSVKHDCEVIRLPHQISSDRVRVCLDYEAGQLSFYELCDPIRHLHTYTASFSEPLHAVLYIWKGSIKISGARQ